jgi:hypothetical protein
MGPKLYDSEHIERFADDQFYAFTRGDKGEVNIVIVLCLAGFIYIVGVYVCVCWGAVIPSEYLNRECY